MKKLLKYWPIKLAGLLLIASAFSMIAVAVGATMTEQTTNNSAQTRPETVQDVVEPETIENPSQQVEAVTEHQSASKEKEVEVEQPAPSQPAPEKELSNDPTMNRITREEYEAQQRELNEKTKNWDGDTSGTPIFNF